MIVGVAFAGHRALSPASIEAPLRTAFALVARAAETVAGAATGADDGETIARAHGEIWSAAEPTFAARLYIGCAQGADRAAMTAWRDGRHGAIHAIFPFADPTTPSEAAWTDDPNTAGGDSRVDLVGISGAPTAFDRLTVIDGAAARAETPPRDAHLEQSRWLVRWADIAVVAWNGRLAAGTGGTADTVALALTKGIPVVWIDTSEADPPVRLLSPRMLWSDGGFSELVDALTDPNGRDRTAPTATVDALVENLLPIFRPPIANLEGANGTHQSEASSDDHDGVTNPPDAETTSRRDYTRGPSDSLRLATTVPGRLLLWSRRVAMSALAASWAAASRSLGSPARADRSAADRTTDEAKSAICTAACHPMISAAFGEADVRASSVGDFHRAAQTILLLIAFAAVAFGTSAAVFPALKLRVVSIELALVVIAFFLWHLSFIATNHRRWSDDRRLAERLRILRATWPMGFDVADDRARVPATWTEWYVAAVRRAAGPPTGFASKGRLAELLRAAQDDPGGIVRGQRSYNARTAHRMSKIHHRLNAIEFWSFVVLVLTLGIFALWYVASDIWHDCPHPAPWVGGVVLMVSALAPTIAAVCLALDAKLGVEENAHKASVLESRFDEILGALETTNSVADRLELMRDAATVLITDIDGWREASVRRRISTL